MLSVKAVLGKEYRAHFGAYVLLCAITCLFLGLCLLGSTADESKTTVLSLLPLFLFTFVALAASIIGKRLVVDEYQLHTHEFLLALPLRRVEVLLIKYFVGLGAVLLLGAIVLCPTTLFASHTEPIGFRFAAYLSLRSLGFLLFWWGLCYLLCLTGRFRPPLIWGLFVLWIALGTIISWDIFALWPLKLVSPTLMPYQREVFPLKEFLCSVSLGGLFLGAGLWLGTVREGQLISSLSGRLSQREKSVVGLVLLASFMIACAIDLRREKEPYRFESDQVLEAETVSLEILYQEPEYRPDAEKLLGWLEPRLLSLKKELGVDTLPVTRIALSRELDGLSPEIEHLEKKDGTLIRCNFSDPDFDRVQVGFLALHIALNRLCEGRGTYEPVHWFLDGFSQWWVEEDPQVRVSEARWVALEKIPDKETFASWNLLTDLHGERLAASLAFSAVKYLEEKVGREAVIKLAKAHFCRSAHRDFRDTLYQWTHSPARVFERHTGLDYEAFLSDWSQTLKQSDAEAGSLSRPRTEYRFGPHSIVCRLHFETPPPPGFTWTVLHKKLSPGESGIDENKLKRETLPWESGTVTQEFTLTDEYSTGDLVWVGVEVAFPGVRHPLWARSERGVCR